MRHIIKGQEPSELKKWKKANPKKRRYPDLDATEKGREAHQAIRQTALKEQFYLCAYCCKAIDEEHSTNEHIASQRAAPQKSLDFSNIVASCDTARRCNQARGSQELLLTPLMAACESELKFRLSGKVKGLTERATQAIGILGLNEPAIRNERKQLMDVVLYGYEMTELPNDDSLLDIMLDLLQKPDEAGRLPPFGPALANIIRHLLIPNNP